MPTGLELSSAAPTLAGERHRVGMAVRQKGQRPAGSREQWAGLVEMAQQGQSNGLGNCKDMDEKM